MRLDSISQPQIVLPLDLWLSTVHPPPHLTGLQSKKMAAQTIDGPFTRPNTSSSVVVATPSPPPNRPAPSPAQAPADWAAIRSSMLENDQGFDQVTEWVAYQSDQGKQLLLGLIQQAQSPENASRLLTKLKDRPSDIPPETYLVMVEWGVDRNTRFFRRMPQSIFDQFSSVQPGGTIKLTGNPKSVASITDHTQARQAGAIYSHIKSALAETKQSGDAEMIADS